MNPMQVMVSKEEALIKMKNTIFEGRKAIVIACADLEFLELLRRELKSRNVSNVEIWQSMEKSSDYVSANIIDDLLGIYRMYDFSDKISVISEPDQYGSLFNYVKTGILTEKEMVDALLYKI